MKKMLKILALLLVITTVVFAAGCAEQGEEGAVEEMSTYYVGTEAQFPPFEIVDDAGNVIGFDVDLMNAIAEDQGFKVIYQDQDFSGLIPALQTGNIDIIASGMTIRPDREEQVDFSEPYINAGLAIAVAVDNEDIQGVDGLQGKTVAVQTGSTGYFKSEELMNNGTIAKIKDFPHVNEAIEEVKIGGADAMINDIPVTNAFIAAQPGVIKVVGEPLNSESYGFAVRTGNTELLEKINTGLQNVKDSGKYDELISDLPMYMEEEDTAEGNVTEEVVAEENVTE
ncbi:Glutamine ABC transporter, periplasmic glutamine-binding protein [Methanosarcina sp. MTP4]|uniref:basic amino acid ABC transporter substrate-binding protein n=1 Tax=Methanosarcina sp. MTP4 TaxID=1434100 RepID=UPI000615F82A|nr:basic amino acid ABC transporter substrate-binding protein [Methanosarcina sp. MTP4]AKB26123.1 Glutamine ABC transporter, periplasmic glutamine-binding protein [Methanosarcina sp. MTP4]